MPSDKERIKRLEDMVALLTDKVNQHTQGRNEEFTTIMALGIKINAACAVLAREIPTFGEAWADEMIKAWEEVSEKAQSPR